MNTNVSDQDEPFRWRNCYADVGNYAHGRTVTNYVLDVVKPAIAALEAKIAELDASSDPVEDLQQETFLAFALALQSIWERQLRDYLIGCAKELAHPRVSASAIAKANWNDLCKHFRTLRGIPIEHFPTFGELDILQLLGNACRHGEGNSAAELWARRPELWPPRWQSPFDDEPQVGPQHPSAIRLTVADLEGIAGAIATFWSDAEYIYNESIGRKHDSLERTLIKERATRRWLPKARDYA
jgi:hypothetical protein